ncbi:Na(+)/H(+) exchange regulatory cofactor NHE-RF1 [Neocloeon triangulifer]|uniref:Na(+)/H(+) exchange regulatory cofactor NHE-RF1 n=1 Tax=Neocloeon triangulifer TaxID=2078957 RepID=UPI00286F8500|nr:Na(+)/H(+) exchange regulatory cofactor NHE-RF1 [Neocloeon triangulifer]
MGMSEEESSVAPRLCHIQKWPDFDGFGFNLHAEKGRVGQYVGKVDDGSPAEAAGLKQGDRIIEVNGVNISNENHRQVVARIKAVPDETRLLVLDSEAEAFFKSHEQVVRGDMPGVIHLTSLKQQQQQHQHEEEQQQHEVASNTSSATTPETDRKHREESPSETTTVEAKSNGSIASADSPKMADKIEKDDSSRSESPQQSNRPPGLNMTAAELRAQLAQRKKFDPKKENMDLRRKFDIVQTL